jgi:hypothetical protein
MKAIKKIQFKNVTQIHSVSFDDPNGMRFWRYHDIVEGFLTDIQIDQVDQNLQYDVCIPFDSEFSKGRSATNRA